MATLSNRERVGKALDLLAEGLLPFIDPRMTAAASQVGGDWVRLISARDESKHGKSMRHHKEDPALLLRVLTEDWRVFSGELSRVEQSFASELREIRNRHAHNDSFTGDDTYRALDTMERLLSAVGAPSQADSVRRMRMDHQRASFEAEVKRMAKAQEVPPTLAGQGLKPWRDVLAPHEDVATGNFSSSEFAADLHAVAFGDPSDVGREYGDPREFFRRTYLTEGLRELLDRAIRRIDGDLNATPIVNLQTNFGGGKTHSMLALWHMFSGMPPAALPQEVQDLVAGRALPDVRRVALVGTHLAPTGTRTTGDGTTVRTLWGELAWQLGGQAAYDLVAEADRTATNPGAALRDLIAAHSPCLILIDEWVAYARQLWGREELPAGTFDTQFTFAQTLTEVVKSIPGALLVISIPASHDPERDGSSGGTAIEVGGPNGQEALQRLQNVVRRVADQWRPASSQESFEIVRRRLFVEPSAAALADIAAIARSFVQFYARHAGEFPREVSEPAYEARIKAAYPLHPELFDRLYQDWSTLDRFQRTRGVLRLMSYVVHALWISQDSAPMILPGTVPLDVSSVSREITQYLPDSWKPIIDTDIDGTGSTPLRIDAERSIFSARMVTRRLARSIFIGSAPTLRSAHRGIERQRIWLGTAVPGDVVGNFGSAMELLTQRATYLYAESSRYWFDTQASVARTAADYADSLRDKPEVIWTEIVTRLRVEGRHRGGFAGVVIAPTTTADIRDIDEVQLVILHPSSTHTRGSADSAARVFAQDAAGHRGTAQRTNRNMVVFLAADTKRMDELADSVRAFLAWTWVGNRRTELDLTPAQVSQVEANINRNGEDVDIRLAQTYHWVLVPVQPDPAQPSSLDVERVEGASNRLAERVSARLTQLGMLSDRVGPQTLRIDLDQRLGSVWSRGHISVGELWGYLARYPYLARLRDRSVLTSAVEVGLGSLLWQVESFALADSYDAASGRYVGLVLPSGDARAPALTDNTLIVAPSVAVAQAASEGLRDEATASPVGGSDGSLTDGVSSEPSAPEPTFRPRRYVGAVHIASDRYARELNRVSQEIIQPLAATPGVTFDIVLEVHATCPDGFPDERVRVIGENARTLRFSTSEFEDQ